jgi:hypothetical protein
MLIGAIEVSDSGRGLPAGFDIGRSGGSPGMRVASDRAAASRRAGRRACGAGRLKTALVRNVVPRGDGTGLPMKGLRVVKQAFFGLRQGGIAFCGTTRRVR